MLYGTQTTRDQHTGLCQRLAVRKSSLFVARKQQYATFEQEPLNLLKSGSESQSFVLLEPR